MIIVFCVGFVIAGQALDVPSLPKGNAGVHTGQAVIKEVSRSAAGNQKLMTHATLSTGETFGLYILWTGQMELQIGERVSFQGEIQPLSQMRQPNGFDEEKYFKAKGMAYKLFPDQLQKLGLVTAFDFQLDKLKERVFQVFDRVFSEKERGIVKAMATGEREDIPKEVQTLYTKAGITHILCISGLHISLMAYYFNRLLTRILHCNKQKSAGATIVFVLAFLVFTGFSPSSVRAFIMVGMVFFAQIVWRKSEWLNNLALAAGVILLVQPLYLWNAGFQLSFMTALGIWISLRGYPPKEGWRGKIGSAFRVSLFASLFSFPLVAYHFSYVSFVGIFVNLLIVPLCGLLLGLCLFTAIGGLLYPPLGNVFGWGVKVILQYYELVCGIAVKVPNAYVLVGTPSLFTIVSYYAFLLVVLYQGRRLVKYAALSVCTLGLFMGFFGNRFFWKENTVAFLDVGQGDAIVISTYDGQAIVIDGGGKFGKDLGENTGMTVVLPYLESLGIDQVAGVFFTHYDRDHMLGALEICQNLAVDGVYISPYPFSEREGYETLKETVEKQGLLLYTVEKGDVSQWGERGELRCLSPEAGIAYADEDDNHGSLVLGYKYGGTEVLLMGDATAEDETVLMETGATLSCDILKLGHHGSQYSSHADFLAETKAQAGIISCGLNNMYGHPQKEVLERVEIAGIAPYRTDIGGTIVATLFPNGTYELQAVGERKTVYERVKERLEGREF